MKKPPDIAAIRHTFNSYQRGVVAPACALTEADLHELDFAEVANRIAEPSVRRQFRQLAIQLLEANLREHQQDRPIHAGALTVEMRQEVHDWQVVNCTWEDALMALVKQGDA